MHATHSCMPRNNVQDLYTKTEEPVYEKNNSDRKKEKYSWQFEESQSAKRFLWPKGMNLSLTMDSYPIKNKNKKEKMVFW